MNVQQHNDGGPAFPHLRKHIGPNTYEPIAEGGMSLCDWFAGMALSGFCANPNIGSEYDEDLDKIANAALSAADAMLVERNRKWAAK